MGASGRSNTLRGGEAFASDINGDRAMEIPETDDQVIGYEFVSLGKMTDFIKKGDDPNTAYEKAKGTYGRFADAAKYIDPRKE